MPPTPSRVNNPTTHTRRRRRPEEAEAEILDATRDLLTRLPGEQVTVSAVMAATTLSRKSFYVYFADRNELLRRLLDPLAARRDSIIEPVYAADSLVLAGQEALHGLARFYLEHGRLLRALAHAAAHDDDTRRAWRGFMEPVVDAHVRLVELEIAAGRISGIDPEPTVRALLAMNLQYFFDELVDNPAPDVDAVASTLTTVWGRVLYGTAR
ncbi:TetR/AcrR family transcriptional regulator [Nocardioides allogilvus]|uniref:TetR/AcrR family transcriptional regulator n=1 Tax=Nocardioides allogilvus TaxID=2072017 RepID=UPI00130085BD|nr:TetR/AcrR family transcriptional regulator [Nocardioides allogilvus]